jgi:hypothetical protein
MVLRTKLIRKMISVPYPTNFSEKFQDQKMDIGIRSIGKTQFFPNCPMPVGAKTISPAIPYTQHKPGKSGKEYSYKMPFPC